MSWTLRPFTPPSALTWSTASLTPRHSNWPRSLEEPLWASTTAILIGPADAPPPLPEPLLPGPPEGWLLAPGALHAAAARMMAAVLIAVLITVASAGRRRYLGCAGMVNLR